MFIAAAIKSKLSGSATVCRFRRIEDPRTSTSPVSRTMARGAPFRSIHYATLEAQKGNASSTSLGSLRERLGNS